MQVGTASARYLIAATGDMSEWIPADPGALPVYETQEKSFEPLTAQDERIWREQGSPKHWKVPNSCMPPKFPGCGKQIIPRGEPSPRHLQFGAPSKGRPSDRSVSSFTLAELAALPADPALLRKRLAGYYAAKVKRGFKGTFEEFLVGGVPRMLGLPVSPGVRAALLRLYVELPGGVSVREIVDPLGRSALAVDPRGHELWEMTQLVFGDRLVPVRQETVLDPLTGMRLGLRFVTVRVEDGFPKGTVLASETVSEVGWTDERPVLPPGCHPKSGGGCP
ncbi:hypothetical protein [Streptosporangium lutulentum]|uniref:Uncharacterized protein n=1 Tax=Streptosporangium lutulentum TaxID=1461250 RepID=A0ABT9QLR8_9ACTN|nr:hypothetical protein [Streptosporangium lutulentum]MDP9847325.1 hypothetical protein [Streptosporangium lutulentum]